MGFFDKLFGKTPAFKPVETQPGILYAPITGRYIPLEEIPDVVFSQGILGPGCGIEPEEELVVAPVDGTVIQIADTKHAVGLESEDGMEFLIHVGLDTVDMNGDGFVPKVKVGDKVRCGQPLLAFSAAKIRAAGHPITTAFLLVNADDLVPLHMQTGYFTKTAQMGQLG